MANTFLQWTQRHKNHHETLRGEKSSSPWYQNDQIPEFIKVAAQCQRASIDANLLEIHFVIEDEPWYGGFFDDENGKTFDMLSCHKNYFVTLKMLNLHICMEDVLGSGLFGRLGEERVVIMGASDTTLIHRLPVMDVWTGRRYGTQRDIWRNTTYIPTPNKTSEMEV
jgi:hypothetical protein